MNTILDHIHLWTTAQTPKTSGRGNRADNQQLLGIQKLRELILELAVRGKLVPQDANDEPASVLLKKIEAEKKRLIKEGKTKKQEVLPKVGEGEKPFDLPEGWEWCYLNDLGVITSSSRVHQKDWQGEGIPFYRAREIVLLSKFGYVNNDLFITEKLYSQHKENGFVPEENDIMITGVGTIGIPYVVKKEDQFYFKDASVLIFKNLFNQYPKYLELFFKSTFWVKEIHKESMGTTVDTLTISRAKIVPIPLPPLTEQHRIVAKVEELMALCDQLEQQQTENNQLHQTLVETLLANLTQAYSPAEQEEAWQRISAHFDTLFTTEYSIDQLKQTILQLAVMGKLVPQNPEDEPASELLKKIAKEKARLVKEGKIKKQAPLPDITDDEKLFNLPEGWEWVRLEYLNPEFQNGVSSRGDKEGKEIVVLRLADIKEWGISLEDTRSLIINECAIANYSLKTNDVLIIRVNGSADIVGRFILCDQDVNAIYCDHFIRMRLSINALIPKYLKVIGSSNLIRRSISQLFITTAGQKTVNQKHIGSLIFSLPPLAEQHRIVAKVDELFALCDALKERLAQAQATQNLLAEAVVERALAKKPGSKVVYATNEQINLAAEP